MRPIDVAFFTAEHDDHHLATVREILNKSSDEKPHSIGIDRKDKVREKV